MERRELILKTSKNLKLKENQINAILNLTSEGATIPFIARYRKEMTGFLDEVAIEKTIETYSLLSETEKRREFILKTVEEKGKLVSGLKEKIDAAATLEELEDLYLPFKERKKTKSDKAIEAGLLKLAKYITSKNPSSVMLEKEAQKFILKKIKTKEEAIDGAKDILVQEIADNSGIRGFVREKLAAGIVVSKVKRGKRESGTTYKDYFDFSEKTTKIASHRIMAISRGEKEGILNVSIEPYFGEESLLMGIQKIFFKRQNELFENIAEKSWKDHLKISIGSEIKTKLFGKAVDDSLEVFSKNLEKILLSPPFGSQVVIGIDPGIRTGCKAVLLDKNGEFLESTVLFLNQKEGEAKKIIPWIEKYNVKGISVGDGTFGRETLAIIKKYVNTKEITVVNVDEDGASVYSASKTARDEFPDLDLTIRGAISIGRRFQDPMAELVKIPPESLGIGQYQHDIPLKKLSEKLKTTIEWSVNKVGVHLNTASRYLLSFVSGLNKKKAQAIIQLRKEKGDFLSREQLKKVKGVGENTFLLSAGFLMIKNADNLLDSTGVHPESYDNVKKIAEFYGISIKELIKHPEKINTDEIKENLNINELSSLLMELKKKGIERGEFSPIKFSKQIKTISDLRGGMILPGVVDNVVDFGAFIDIGIKQKGLVHISEISDKFINNIHDFLSVGDKISVKVLEIDKNRNRISLSMK